LIPEIGQKLYGLGILDFLVLNNDFEAFDDNIFSNQSYQVTSKSWPEMFPDKLKDLHGYSYKILTYLDIPSVTPIGDKLHGTSISLMEEMVRHQNASYHYQKNISRDEIMASNFAENLLDPNFDFCPNTRIILSTMAEKFLPIETYRTSGYCALIAQEPRISFLSYMASPFDLATWVLILLALLVGATIYALMNYRRFSHSVRSGFGFLFGMYGLFLGQGSNLFEQRSRKTAYFQTFIFFAFFFGTLYQSLIISFIFLNRNAQSIKTLEDLKNSELTIYSDQQGRALLTISGDNKELLERIKIVPTITKNISKILDKKSALLVPCHVTNYISVFLQRTEQSTGYYKMKEQVYPYYLQYITRKTNPFAEKIREYSLGFFESGISGHLNEEYENLLRMAVDKWLGTDPSQYGDAESYLSLDDLFGIFKILLIGYGVATFVFILEWIWIFIKNKRSAA
jgi:hypothetical protein